jgi:hypothetical protein
LQAISETQCGRIDLARAQLERWLPPVAADWALAPASGLAKIFRISGLTFAHRSSPDFESTKTAATQSWLVSSPTVH